MKVLSVASECVPLVKTGGLADVVGALPGALKARGVEMRVMIPAFSGVLDKLGGAREVWADWNLFGGSARVLLGDLDGVPVMALDAAQFKGGGGV